MKRIVLFLVIGCLVFSLTACGDKGNAEQTDGTTTAAETTDSATEETAEAGGTTTVLSPTTTTGQKGGATTTTTKATTIAKATTTTTKATTTTTTVKATTTTTAAKVSGNIAGKTYTYTWMDGDGYVNVTTVTVGNKVGEQLIVISRVHIPLKEYYGDGMSEPEMLAQAQREKPDGVLQYQGKYYLGMMDGTPGTLYLTEIKDGFIAFESDPNYSPTGKPDTGSMRFTAQGDRITVSDVTLITGHITKGGVLTEVK